VTTLPADAGGTSEFGTANVSEFVGDMADESFCREVVAGTCARFGGVNHLVNNAFSFNATGVASTRNDWARIMEAGPAAYAQMTSLASEQMIQQMAQAQADDSAQAEHGGGGSIVNISSISAFIAQPDRWTYNSAKGAVHQLTKVIWVVGWLVARTRTQPLRSTGGPLAPAPLAPPCPRPRCPPLPPLAPPLAPAPRRPGPVSDPCPLPPTPA
jgi:hypothetical protein